MTSADYTCLVIIIICVLLGAAIGFTRGIFGFMGIYFGATLAAKSAPDGDKYLMTAFGIFAVVFIVGFLFYGSTRFSPLEAMDPVFGALFGFLMGWGICHVVLHYYVAFHNDIPYYAEIYRSSFAMDIHDIRPYQEVMNRTTGLRHPEPDIL